VDESLVVVCTEGQQERKREEGGGSKDFLKF